MQVGHEPLLSQSLPYLVSDDLKSDIIIPYSKNAINKMQELYPHFSLGDCEYMMYGSFFYKELLKFNGILLHSSCVVLDGYAYLFSAPSGTGKSTHTQRWLSVFKSAKILNDDKPAIIVKDNICYACGTPFSGKTNLNLNEIYPIKGIAFLERSKDNWIVEMPQSKKVFSILNQTLRPDEIEFMDNAINVIGNIVNTVKIYKFGCNISDEAVYTSYEAMNNMKIDINKNMY